MIMNRFIKHKFSLGVTLAAALAVIASTAMARLEAPDHILYGNVTLFGNPVAPGTVVEMRTMPTGDVLARYIMGRDSTLGGQYALRTPMDVVEPRIEGRARPGDPIQIFIGSQLAAQTSVGNEGTAIRLDLDPQNMGTGPSISIDDVEALEGNSGLTPMTFTVTMNTTSDEDMVIDWHTVDVTALGGIACSESVDYLSASSTLVIPQGEMEGQLTVQVCANTIIQPDREYEVHLVPQTPAVLAKGIGTGLIIDDDDVPTLMVDNQTILEPSAGETAVMGFSPMLSRSHGFDISIDYQTVNLNATAGIDYEPIQGTLTIPAGEVSATLPVLILGTGSAGPPKSFRLDFANPVNVNADELSALGIIVDPRYVPAITHEDDIVNGEDGIVGLTEPTAVALSPDGSHLYVASESGNSVLVFSRNSFNGRLSYVDMYNNQRVGFETANLGGPMDLVVSGDGLHVYVASRLDRAIAVLARNPGSGALSFVENQIQGAAGPNGGSSVNGLDGVKALALSPDGEHLYAASGVDHAVAVFSRDETTGALQFLRAYVKDQDDGHGNTLSHLDRPAGIIVSGDGAQVYVASRFGNAVHVLDRDSDAASDDFGLLQLSAIYRKGIAGITNIGGAIDLALSEDGLHLYVAAENDNAVVLFDRQPDGTLSQRQSWLKGGQDLPGLGGASSITLSPDGNELFVPGFADHSLTVFRRYAEDEDGFNAGQLKPRQTLFDNQGRIMNMAGPVASAASDDDKHLYVAANEDNAIVILNRVPLDMIFADGFEAP